MRFSHSSWPATAYLLFGFVAKAFAQDDDEEDDEARYEELKQHHPSLYTGNYGDCLGGESLFNITKYDVAYFRGDTAVLFHLNGATSVRQEDVICEWQPTTEGLIQKLTCDLAVHIAVDACETTPTTDSSRRVPTDIAWQMARTDSI